MALDGLPRFAALIGVLCMAPPAPCPAGDAFMPGGGEDVGLIGAPESAGPQVPAREDAAGGRVDPLDRYRAIVERPLFSETRRPPPDVEPVVRTTGPASRLRAAVPGEFRLLGIVITPGLSRAVFNTGPGHQADLKALGDDVNGWQLAAIEPRLVRLKKGTEEKIIELERKAAPPARQARAASVAAARAALPSPDPAPDPAVGLNEPGNVATMKDAALEPTPGPKHKK